MKLHYSVRCLLAISCIAPIAITEMASSAQALPHMQTASTASSVDHVRFRRGYGNRSGRYVGRGGGNGVGIGLGILGAVIAGGIIADAVGNNGSGYDRCAARFQSFDPESGTYTTYDGETRRCPYL